MRTGAENDSICSSFALNETISYRHNFKSSVNFRLPYRNRRQPPTQWPIAGWEDAFSSARLKNSPPRSLSVIAFWMVCNRSGSFLWTVPRGCGQQMVNFPLDRIAPVLVYHCSTLLYETQRLTRGDQNSRLTWNRRISSVGYGRWRVNGVIRCENIVSHWWLLVSTLFARLFLSRMSFTGDCYEAKFSSHPMQPERRISQVLATEDDGTVRAFGAKMA